MAFGFQVNGRFIDLFDSSTVSFKKQNAAIASYNADSVQDSYSLPVDVPLTVLNNQLLGWPGREDSWNETVVSKPCIFFAGEGQSVGIPMFSGKLYIKGSGPERASVFMVVDGLAVDKDKKFKDVDMGGWDNGGVLDLRSVAKDTTIQPLNYDFVFFPVYNPDFTAATYSERVNDFLLGSQLFAYNYQNYYDPFINHYLPYSSDKNMIDTPFLRLEYVITKVCDLLGFTYDDRFFNSDEELQLICVYNNKNISKVGNSYPAEIKYNDHVPAEMGLVEFLRAIADNFWCGLVVDQYRKTISILPYDDIIQQSHSWEWTDKILYDYGVEGDSNQPSFVGYGEDSADGMFRENYAFTLLAGQITPTEINDNDGYPGVGIYYAVRDNRVVKVTSHGGFVYETLIQRHYGNPAQGSGPEWRSKVIPLFQYSHDHRLPGFGYHSPAAKIAGAGSYILNDELVEESGTLSSVRLTIYRGMRTVTSLPFPYASSNAYDPTNEAETFDHSLLYDRANNMYNKRAARWIYAMEYKKVVKRRIHLRLTDVTSLKDFQKIKINGQFYLWREISLTFTASGLQPAECELWRLPVS